MFNMYRRRFYPRSRFHAGSEEELGHDRFNYMNPTVNYDKWPRRLRPKKSSLKVELEAPESPHMHDSDGSGSGALLSSQFQSQRHCHGSIREHQRLLNLRSSRHKCSPRCRVKSPKSSSPTLSTDALVKVFACLGVQDGSATAGAGGSSSAAGAGPSCNSASYLEKHKGCQQHHHKRPKRLNVFSASLSSIRYSSSRMKDAFSSGSNTNGSAAAGLMLDGGLMNVASGVGGIELYELAESRHHHHGKNNSSSGERVGSSGLGRMAGYPSSSEYARETATNICRQYIRSSSRYLLLDHLPDIGSRIDKQWFMIRDATLKTERLLTIVPLSGSASYGCDVTTSDADATRNALVDLFTALQHPYIYPVLDVDFVYGAVTTSSASYSEEAKPVLVTVFPFNSKGSLKDLIYRSRWQDDWGQKYRQRSEGLPLLQVQRLGRQILEALLFLQERGFPPFGHLHSGNVIIQNGVARLTGFENTLLGFSSRIHPLVKSILPGIPAAVDTICFGHILFEMCSGYELYAPKPTARHLEDLQSYPQVVEVLDYIFNSPCQDYPSIGNLAILEFFRNIDLREMRCSTIYYNAKLTNAALSLLEQVQQKRRRRDRQQQREQHQLHHHQHHHHHRHHHISRSSSSSTSCSGSSSSPSSSSKLDPKASAPAAAAAVFSLDGNDPVTSNSGATRQVDIHYIAEESQKHSEEEDDLLLVPPTVPRERAASTAICCQTAAERNRSELHLNLGTSTSLNVAAAGLGAVRRNRMSSSSTSPSLSLVQLVHPSVDVLLDAHHPKLISNNVAHQTHFYCSGSDESFQTPLETPTTSSIPALPPPPPAPSRAGEGEYVLYTSHQHHPVAAALLEHPHRHHNSLNNHPQPSLVLTPPDLNEAFTLEDHHSIHC